MEVGTQYDFVLPSRQSLGVGSLIPQDFIPEPGTLSRVTYAPLVASSRRSCQTTVVLFNTESQRNQRFFSRGSLCLCGYTLGLLPRTPTLPSPKVTHRPRTTVTGCLPRSGQLSEEGVAAAPPPAFARGRGRPDTKKRSQPL